MNRKRRDVTQSYKLQFSIEDMRRFGGEAWGQIGADIVDRWCEFNAAYFGGVLKPVPLVISNTQPFGKRIAFCSYDPDASGRTITLNVPARHHVLVADNNTLLHEMLHQYLFERGENAAHMGEPWRREIMRLTKVITGRQIWAGRSKTMRVNGSIIRMNAPHPETGEPSVPQKVIARWPHDGFGINFGKLGCNGELRVARGSAL
jgi:hypothetical protein